MLISSFTDKYTFPWLCKAFIIFSIICYLSLRPEVQIAKLTDMVLTLLGFARLSTRNYGGIFIKWNGRKTSWFFKNIRNFTILFDSSGKSERSIEKSEKSGGIFFSWDDPPNLLLNLTLSMAMAQPLHRVNIWNNPRKRISSSILSYMTFDGLDAK